MDELSILGENTVAEFYHERGFLTSVLSPTQFPLQVATLADLRGAGREANAAIVRSILEGADRGPRRDAVLLNASAALMVAGQTKTMAAGWEQAAELIDSGRAERKLAELIKSR
jgi:anthranilate phosphoribosyltransferase